MAFALFYKFKPLESYKLLVFYIYIFIRTCLAHHMEVTVMACTESSSNSFVENILGDMTLKPVLACVYMEVLTVLAHTDIATKKK